MKEKRFREYLSPFHPDFGKYEVNFGEGVPERTDRKNSGEVFIYPEELLDKICGGCLRFTSNNDGYHHGDCDLDGYHCSMRGWRLPIHAEDKACVDYWDRADHEHADREHEEAVEKRREELWAIYAVKDPVKLPIVNDGYGVIPKCPTCGEMPYSLAQCHWCGQRFIQDEEVDKYSTPTRVDYKCPSCGTMGKADVSKYNGHKHFKCEECGFAFME